jgi:hypothetical protein
MRHWKDRKRGASAQDAIAAPAQKTICQSGKSAMIPSRAVINSPNYTPPPPACGYYPYPPCY